MYIIGSPYRGTVGNPAPLHPPWPPLVYIYIGSPYRGRVGNPAPLLPPWSPLVFIYIGSPYRGTVGNPAPLHPPWPTHGDQRSESSVQKPIPGKPLQLVNLIFVLYNVLRKY